jgi:hypothetical protein
MSISNFAHDPSFAPLRSDARWAPLLLRLGLPAARA